LPTYCTPFLLITSLPPPRKYFLDGWSLANCCGKGKIHDDVSLWLSRGAPGWKNWFIPVAFIPVVAMVTMRLVDDCYGDNCLWWWQLLGIFQCTINTTPMTAALLLCCMKVAPHADAFMKLVQPGQSLLATVPARGSMSDDNASIILDKFKRDMEEVSAALDNETSKLNLPLIIPLMLVWVFSSLAHMWQLSDELGGDDSTTPFGVILGWLIAAFLCLATCFFPVVFVNSCTHETSRKLVSFMVSKQIHSLGNGNCFSSAHIYGDLTYKRTQQTHPIMPCAVLVNTSTCPLLLQYGSPDPSRVLLTKQWLEDSELGWALFGFRPSRRNVEPVLAAVLTGVLAGLSRYLSSY
jgi:hypothetical protein